MEIEKLVMWAKEQIRELSLGRLLLYFFVWIACCAVGAISLNVLLPEWLRWFDGDDFGAATGLFIGCGFAAYMLYVCIFIIKE